MKNYIFATCLAFTLSGCARFTNNRVNFGKPADQSVHPAVEAPPAVPVVTVRVAPAPVVEKPAPKGGAPGRLKLEGSIVLTPNDPDPRITIISETGVDAPNYGTRTDRRLLVLSNATPPVDYSRLAQIRTLVAINCNEVLITKYAIENWLQVRPAPKVPANGMLAVRANTIVLCGNLDDYKLQSATFTANQIILSGLEYRQNSAGGNITLNSNNLLLLGPNVIDMRATVNGSAPSIYVGVANEFETRDNGKLSLITMGANAKP